MQQKSSGKMVYVLLSISIIPLLFFGIIILFLSTELFTKAMYQEIEAEMGSSARCVAYMLDLAFPGDYHLEGDSSLQLYKGEYDLTQNFALVDQVKKSSGFDVTLFYQDTRILTTIYNTDGQRIVGSAAPQTVLHDVLEGREPHFYTNTRIFNVEYFSYYLPLQNEDGSTVGMIFIGKPSSQVNHAIRNASYPLVIAVIAVTFLIACAIWLYTKKFDIVLQKIRSFLFSVSTGNLTVELDQIVLRRKDEFGDIGRSAVHMQKSLHHTVEQDALTELYNRRAGDRRLHQVMERSAQNGTSFCVCIGDIDFFKNINDTYGHACGDMVLKQLGAILREHMSSVGFAARWGGEEFLLVFDRMDIDQSLLSLNILLDKIRLTQIPYEDHTIQFTMTFGMVLGDGADHTTLLKNADQKLYNGKHNGRNQIVC